MQGVGRTLNVALTDCVLQSIRHQLTQGIKPENISVNPFEMLFEIRKRRPRVTTHFSQVKQAYEIADRFYQQLIKNPSTSTL
jgi:protein tyrosine phosphatase